MRIFIFVCFCFAALALANNSIDNSDAVSDRKNKALACINLVKSVLFNDATYFEDFLEKNEFESKAKIPNQFLEKTLLNCYNDIALLDLPRIINSDYKELNPFTKINKNLMNLENFDKKYKTDENKLKKDKSVFDKVLLDLKEEVNCS